MSKLAALGGKPVFESPLDYRKIWPPIDESTAEKIRQLYLSRKWTAFDDTELEFSRVFAAAHTAAHGIFTVNGTVTLQCALAAYGVGPGDEVLVSPATWYATAIAVRHVGAKPVFVDIEPDTMCIDPNKIEAAINERTRAIIPVHAYGSMADMDRIMALARSHDLRVIEDCAHMHGGVWDGKGVGSIGDVGSFSFQNSKTMSSGEGGICITNDAQIADRLFRMKQVGYRAGELPRNAKSGPPPGLLCYNFRATAFQALILQEQLGTLVDRLSAYEQAVSDLKQRLSQRTQIRFQVPGKKADRQGYYGLLMMFDDPMYADIPIDVIQKAMLAEGVTLLRAEGPIYDFILFNLTAQEYRIDQPCVVTEQVCARALWLFHAFLGLDRSELQKIGDVIEKVVTNIDELKALARRA